MTDKAEPIRGQHGAWRFTNGLAAFCFVYAALSLPGDFRRIGWDMFRAPPVELFVFLFVVAIVPQRFRRLVAVLGGLALAVILVVKLADMAAFEALSRPFNPVLDLNLLHAGWVLLSGSIGDLAAAAAVVAVVIAILLIIAAAISSALRLSASAAIHRRLAMPVGALAIVAAVVAPAIVSAGSSILIKRHAERAVASLSDLETFRKQAASDPLADIGAEERLAALDGKDVLLVFVESYGRTVLDKPEYRADVLPVLDAFGETVDRNGFSAASGYLTSPVAGGQSWLAHASVLSGLWIDSQQRYNSLIVSDRATLIDDFGEAGWRTVAVMPAITMPWPEGETFGYDAIYNEKRLDYRGKPFNWVTMPDQYTLSAFDRMERKAINRRPLFAEIALISSHAPWTPVPELVEWSEIGDGRIFSEQAETGPTPEEVWSDMDRVRVHYRRSVEYALSTLSSYVGERLDEDFVLIVLGDHQPARSITGPTENRDVPYHIISDDAALVERLAASLDLAPGIVPGDGVPSMPMSDFRERFVRALSGENEGEPDFAPRGAGPT